MEAGPRMEGSVEASIMSYVV
jgi:hypothetical protein